jgi:hypothetical protein
MSLKRARKGQSVGTAMWEALPWQSVAVNHSELGDFQDSVFLGLEELDGNAYLFNKGTSGYSVAAKSTGSSSSSSSNSSSTGSNKKRKATESDIIADADASDPGDLAVEKPKKRVSLKSLRKENANKKKKGGKVKSDGGEMVGVGDDDEHVGKRVSYATEMWGGIQLHGLLAQALIKLGFQVPTPIQQSAIPMILRGKHDVVGAAETGSGKTLAFCLPVINRILNEIQGNREDYLSLQNRSRCPRALVIAPTRELALQITAVAKEVCAAMVSLDSKWFPAKVNVVAVVGGMAEQKQRRLLSGRSAFVDIIVGTPGRLCELVQDDEIVCFQDMSQYVQSFCVFYRG